MKRILTPLALGLLAAGLAAQAQKLTANKVNSKLATVTAALGNTPKSASLTNTEIKKTTYISAMVKDTSRHEMAYAKLGVGLHHSWWGKYDRPGAWLTNYGRVYSAKKKGHAKAFNESFTWTYNTGKTLKGVMKVYFSGYYYGDKASITAQFEKDTLAPTKAGRFYIKKEYPINGNQSLSYTFSMVGTTATNKKAYFSGKLSFYFEPAVTLPTLQWVKPSKNNSSCGNGKIVGPNKVEFGKPFNVALDGANDAVADYGILFIGNSDKKFFFLPLPFTLGNSCKLQVNIFAIKMAQIDKNGHAAVPYTIPGTGFWARYFHPVYFQWAYKVNPTKNPIGMVLTDYGYIDKK